MHKRLVILALLFLQSWFALGQSEKIKVTARFDKDSVRLGEPVLFYLTVKYPGDWQVVLPDSTHNYAPFEYQKKRFYSTRTSSQISTDSVVYTLATFEIDSIQTLSLPAYAVQAKDCTAYYSNIDTVFFTHLVKQVPDSVSAEQLPLKINTEYNAVSWLFNYPMFSIVGGILLVIAVAGWLLFGKKIKKYFKVKRLQKKHEEFLQDFDSILDKLSQGGFSSQYAERTVVIWKKYMEDLLAKPYTKFTTRELKALEKDETLHLSLSVIDRSIYGQFTPDSLDSFTTLKEFTQSQFNKKLEEIRHE